MDVGTALSVAQTLFAALQCTQLNEVLSIFGYNSQLDDLKDTVESINAVLRDAEAKQELSQQDQHLIKKLKDAVFEADDMFDEFLTLVEQKRILEADGSVSKKVSNFFSRSKNPLSLAYRMSSGVKDIKKKLDDIAYSNQFNLKIDPEPIRMRSRETCSFVDKAYIIGREHDLEKIVGTLLNPKDQRDVSVISIVGIGGLGKTTLAQLVFHHPKVKNAFPLRLWTCVADQDQKELDVAGILHKILASIPHSDPDQGSTVDQLQSQLREQLAAERYLLVLDDVWTENHNQWCKLAENLIGNKRGSCIVVTTRSQETAKIAGGLIYELPGLSPDNSWFLFQKRAFASELNLPAQFVRIGQKIVTKCAGVPLAVQVAGTLLYGQSKSKWLSFQENGLAGIKDHENYIMHILKLSFHNLPCPVKNPAIAVTSPTCSNVSLN